jgi:hypothetical protein
MVGFVEIPPFTGSTATAFIHPTEPWEILRLLSNLVVPSTFTATRAPGTYLFP